MTFLVWNTEYIGFSHTPGAHVIGPLERRDNQEVHPSINALGVATTLTISRGSTLGSIDLW